MATIKTVIRKNEKRKDGTWNVLIRLTHEKKVKYLRTSIFVEKKDLTSTYKIKNPNILNKCQEIENNVRSRLLSLNIDLLNIDIDTIVSYINNTKEDKTGIDFVAFSNNWILKSNLKGAKNYQSAVNAFCAFFGRRRILCNEITSKVMKSFEEFLSDKKRAQSLYTNAIVKLYNEARNFFNDEDNNIIRIKNLISRYKPQKQNVAEKRSIDIHFARKIIKLEPRGDNSRRDLAKDCFVLSLCLMGMNSVDLYNASIFDGEYIIYNRTKTADRRKHDKALMKVKVHEHIKTLFYKYHDSSKRVFNFYKRYSSYKSFNRALNIGLKEVAQEVGLDYLSFYSARHTFGTIAANKCGINKYIINDMLCHVDENLRVTELYIEKDFTEINAANKTFIDYLMGE